MAQGSKGQPKIQGFFATAADVAVVLLRESSRKTVVFRIDYSARRPAKVERGAVFRGRFYPSRCDISPDGRKFLYFVMGGGQSGYKEQHYCWTAISSPPSLKADFLLPHGDTWGGGGFFLSRNAVLIRNGSQDQRKDYAPHQGQVVDGIRLFFDKLSSEAPRPHVKKSDVDRGWTTSPFSLLLNALKIDDTAVSLGFEPGRASKSAGGAQLTRSVRFDRGDFSSFRYVLTDKHGNPVAEDAMRTVTWADFDRRGRLWLASGDTISIYNKPAKAEAAPDQRIVLSETAAR